MIELLDELIKKGIPFIVNNIICITHKGGRLQFN